MKRIMAVLSILALTGCVAKSDFLKLQDQVKTLNNQSKEDSKLNSLRFNHLKHRNKLYADRIDFNAKMTKATFAKHVQAIMYVYRYGQQNRNYLASAFRTTQFFLGTQMFGPGYFLVMGLHLMNNKQYLQGYFYVLHANRVLNKLKKDKKTFKNACNMVDCETARVMSELVLKNMSMHYKCKVADKVFHGNPRLLLQRKHLKKYKTLLKTCKKMVKKTK